MSPDPPAFPLIFRPDSKANNLKSVELREDEFLRLTPIVVSCHALRDRAGSFESSGEDGMVQEGHVGCRSTRE
jgi:hypothetical protein